MRKILRVVMIMARKWMNLSVNSLPVKWKTSYKWELLPYEMQYSYWSQAINQENRKIIDHNSPENSTILPTAPPPPLILLPHPTLDFSTPSVPSRSKAKAVTKRAHEVQRIVEMDVVSVDLLELVPASEYEVAMRRLGSDNSRQVWCVCHLSLTSLSYVSGGLPDWRWVGRQWNTDRWCKDCWKMGAMAARRSQRIWYIIWLLVNGLLIINFVCSLFIALEWLMSFLLGGDDCEVDNDMLADDLVCGSQRMLEFLQRAGQV